MSALESGCGVGSDLLAGLSGAVNFPVKNLELKDYIPLDKLQPAERTRSKYNLISNIVHDGKPGEGCYRAFVQRKSEEAW